MTKGWQRIHRKQEKENPCVLILSGRRIRWPTHATLPPPPRLVPPLSCCSGFEVDKYSCSSVHWWQPARKMSGGWVEQDWWCYVKCKYETLLGCQIYFWRDWTDDNMFTGATLYIDLLNLCWLPFFSCSYVLFLCMFPLRHMPPCRVHCFLPITSASLGYICNTHFFCLVSAPTSPTHGNILAHFEPFCFTLIYSSNIGME